MLGVGPGLVDASTLVEMLAANKGFRKVAQASSHQSKFAKAGY
jgi:hypothetical protein